MNTNDELYYDAEHQQLICQGEWTLANLPQLKKNIEQLKLNRAKTELVINGENIKKMDSAGAWLLTSWSDALKKKHIKIELINFKKEYETLINIVEIRLEEEKKPLAPPKELPFVPRLGKIVLQQLSYFQEYLAFVGKLTFEALKVFGNPKHIRIDSLASVIYRTGFQALPIIALLSFMIGVVITYQMGLQLQNYGANIYIVDLLGLAILREFGPLLTAIMVAGRTGSSFTAQIGMMKLNQEIDALDTMGVTPGELLLLPRIVGLFIALPLLTMWSNVFGILGGMVMANNMLNISWHDFLQRFPSVIPLKTFIIGMGKAPIFALIIASIGCFQGVKVEGSADSVGQNTTRSVVLAIFFIIVADAVFSVIFSKMKI